MIMAAEKRKSVGGNNTPAKFVKNQQGKSPAGGQGGNKFGGGKKFGGQQQSTPGKQNQQQKGGSPQKQQQQQNKPNQKNTPQTPAAKKVNVPPPPPVGAKKVELQQNTATKTPQKQQQQPQQQKGQKKGKGPLNKVSPGSKPIRKGPKKNRFQRFTQRMAVKPRPAGACERALKAEQELGHGGRVYLIKVADPPITEQMVKSWNAGIETAVFSRSVEPRQFLVIFKHDADVKKGVEALKKTKFAGGQITIEEKLDSDSRVTSNPDIINPFCLYVTNIHSDATRDDVKKLFTKCTSVTNPRKHNPKVGTSTKFCFVAFDSANDALAAFKDNYTATLSGNTIVMRFSRVSHNELKKTTEVAKPAAPKVEPKKPAAQQPPAKTSPKKELKPVKVEAEEEDDDEDDEDDDDDDEEKVKEEGDSDDDDDGLGDDDDDDDEDDDDDDDDLDEDDDDDDDDDDE